MRQLSGLDASFLFLETPQMPMHVGAMHIFALAKGHRGSYLRDLRQHVASRLPLLPVFRRRLWWMPLNMANPAWVDSEPDLTQHIVEIKLPADARTGDGLAALEAQVGLLHPVLLDRSLPLWKMHVFTGLAPGPDGRKRVGVYTQLHHAAVDGQAAVALANILLDVTPEARTIDVVRSTRRRVFRLGMAEMLRGALGNEFAQVSKIVRDLPSTIGTLTGAARTAVGSSALFGLRKGKVSNLTLAPATAFNVSVGTGRAFAAVSLPMAELKALGKASGATINDMVLTVCSGALRHYLQGNGTDRQDAGGGPVGAGRQCHHLQRAGAAGAAVHGRRPHVDQLPDLDRGAWHGTEHHGAELRPVARFRIDGRCGRGAGCQGPGECDRRGVR